jgi:hypothetical protein
MSESSPESTGDLRPTLYTLVSIFDVYDREDSLGESLNKYNPNDSEQLRGLFHELYLSNASVDKVSTNYKLRILTVLQNALADPTFDFDRILDRYNLAEQYISLPTRWSNINARAFFEQAYLSVYGKWAAEVVASGHSIPSPTQLGINENAQK